MKIKNIESAFFEVLFIRNKKQKEYKAPSIWIYEVESIYGNYTFKWSVFTGNLTLSESMDGKIADIIDIKTIKQFKFMLRAIEKLK